LEHRWLVESTLTGWRGHADPFAFEQHYRPAVDIRQMLTGTQSPLGMALTELGVDIMLEADIKEVMRASQVSIGHPHGQRAMATRVLSTG